MQVSNFHDDETLPRSVKQKTDRESASQCKTKKCESFPAFDWRKMLSVNSDPQCEKKTTKTLSVISATQCENKNETLSVNSVTQCENKDKMLSVNSAS